MPFSRRVSTQTRTKAWMKSHSYTQLGARCISNDMMAKAHMSLLHSDWAVCAWWESNATLSENKLSKGCFRTKIAEKDERRHENECSAVLDNCSKEERQWKGMSAMKRVWEESDFFAQNCWKWPLSCRNWFNNFYFLSHVSTQKFLNFNKISSFLQINFLENQILIYAE